MTVAKTDYHETQVADRIFANSAPDGANDGCHVALWTSSPSNAPDETNEVGGDGYSVQNVTAASWSITASTANPRKYENASVIDYGTLDSSTTTSVVGVVLYDGSNTATDNALWYGDLDSTKTVSAGDEFKINSGSLTIAED